jgi:hypothetical protein
MTPDPNDDKTVIAGAAAAAAAASPAGAGWLDNPLPVGTRLAEFEIVGLIGIGGFGIVYLAHDHSLGRRVALKEYMPQALAARGTGAAVSVRSARHAETFEAGRRSFVNEARLLAQFDHPSLVKVYRFWEANGTAYMVMPYYEGRTLKAMLQTLHAPPDEAWLTHLLRPLLDALEAIHEVQVFHRDIAPDNILLLAGDRPVLLDFGAARHVISGMTQALTVILKPGYAPIEQYAEIADLQQGAWTDLYGLAAVVYFAITGKTPAPAVGRMMNDTMAPLAQQAAGRYSDRFLRAIDAALAVKPTGRPQSVAEFRALLGLPEPAASTLPADLAPVSVAVSNGRSPAATAPRKRRWFAAAVALGGAALAAWLLLRDATPDPRAVADAASAARPASPSAAAPTDPTPAPAAERAFDPLDEMDRIFEQRDREHGVSVTMSESRVEIGRGKLSFNVRSAKAGYLYVLMVGTDRQHLYLLFPNQVDSENRISAGAALQLPRKGWSMVAGGPPGINQFVAFVAENRRDFAAAGLVKTDPFAEFPLESVARAVRAAGSAASPLLGTPVCASGAAECSPAYGAAVFTIEEVEPARR